MENLQFDELKNLDCVYSTGGVKQRCWYIFSSPSSEDTVVLVEVGGVQRTKIINRGDSLFNLSKGKI